jgi:hypothetical protein
MTYYSQAQFSILWSYNYNYQFVCGSNSLYIYVTNDSHSPYLTLLTLIKLVNVTHDI